MLIPVLEVKASLHKFSKSSMQILTVQFLAVNPRVMIPPVLVSISGDLGKFRCAIMTDLVPTMRSKKSRICRLPPSACSSWCRISSSTIPRTPPLEVVREYTLEKCLLFSIAYPSSVSTRTPHALGFIRIDHGASIGGRVSSRGHSQTLILKGSSLQAMP